MQVVADREVDDPDPGKDLLAHHPVDSGKGQVHVRGDLADRLRQLSFDVLGDEHVRPAAPHQRGDDRWRSVLDDVAGRGRQRARVRHGGQPFPGRRDRATRPPGPDS